MSRLVRHEQAPKRLRASLLQPVAELLERGPARVGNELVVGVRLHVQVLAADRAEAGAVGRVQDLLGQLERDRVARPGGQLELVVVDDVLAAELVGRARVGGVVLAGVDVDVDDRIGEAAHARAVQPHVEREPEVEPGRRLRDRQRGLDLVRHRQVALAAELERLELDRDRVALLVPRAEAQPAQRVAGHPAPSLRDNWCRLPARAGRRPRRRSPASARAAARGRA